MYRGGAPHHCAAFRKHRQQFLCVTPRCVTPFPFTSTSEPLSAPRTLHQLTTTPQPADHLPDDALQIRLAAKNQSSAGAPDSLARSGSTRSLHGHRGLESIGVYWRAGVGGEDSWEAREEERHHRRPPGNNRLSTHVNYTALSFSFDSAN
ncbi:hypothetical protein E2C01_068447 [Portunus trituberculatus]|uniref:Uncharacterized protein n=1 Tax=Portunus trituberculatus TaxID=210409 RepID=A0A5B7HMF6_PORTR|nr:hypothetical protein [Portunus trituberculatus]